MYVVAQLHYQRLSCLIQLVARATVHLMLFKHCPVAFAEVESSFCGSISMSRVKWLAKAFRYISVVSKGL
jgi:hypothetical protein